VDQPRRNRSPAPPQPGGPYAAEERARLQLVSGRPERDSGDRQIIWRRWRRQHIHTRATLLRPVHVLDHHSQRTPPPSACAAEAGGCWLLSSADQSALQLTVQPARRGRVQQLGEARDYDNTGGSWMAPPPPWLVNSPTDAVTCGAAPTPASGNWAPTSTRSTGQHPRPPMAGRSPNHPRLGRRALLVASQAGLHVLRRHRRTRCRRIAGRPNRLLRPPRPTPGDHHRRGPHRTRRRRFPDLPLQRPTRQRGRVPGLLLLGDRGPHLRRADHGRPRVTGRVPGPRCC